MRALMGADTNGTNALGHPEGVFICPENAMDPSLFARGLVLGFTIAAAVGPISLLTIRRTLAHGRIYGLASGMGVALADATYGGIAAFGLTALTSILVGGAASCSGSSAARSSSYLALADDRPAGPTRSRSPTTGRVSSARSLSIFGLTMTNPMTILSFAGDLRGPRRRRRRRGGRRAADARRLLRARRAGG